MKVSTHLHIYHQKQQELGINIQLPGSKSESNRALILQAISKNKIHISNLSDSDDTLALQQALSSNQEEINCGHAGTTLRFLTSYFANKPNEIRVLTGSTQLQKRPIAPLVNALIQLGAEIEYLKEEGFPPLKIIGKKLDGTNTVTIDANISSQFISSLLLIGSQIKNGLKLKLATAKVSEPYLQLTIHTLSQFGIQCKQSDNYFELAEQEIQAGKIEIESDWSAASYWYAIKALGFSKKITLNGLRKTSSQGDQIITEYMKLFGVGTIYHSDGIELIEIPFEIKPMTIDCLNSPDLAQTLIVLTAALNLPYSFSGLTTLVHKETNRIVALQNELLKFGFSLTNKADSYSLKAIQKVDSEQIITLKTYDDHRMALSFACLSLIWKYIQIENPSVISKSYPNFWNDLNAAGFELKFN